MDNVVPIEHMDDATFYKHYNARHLDDLGLSVLRPHIEGSMATPSLRAFHNRKHSEDDYQTEHNHD